MHPAVALATGLVAGFVACFVWMLGPSLWAVHKKGHF